MNLKEYGAKQMDSVNLKVTANHEEMTFSIGKAVWNGGLGHHLNRSCSPNCRQCTRSRQGRLRWTGEPPPDQMSEVALKTVYPSG